MNPKNNLVHYSTDVEANRRKHTAQMLRQCPLPDAELLENLGLFINSKTLARLKFMDFIYQQIVEVQGVVMELGTRWGQNLCHFAALRGIYEPFNRHRKLIAFDTFSGFPAVASEDGAGKMMAAGNYSVTSGYEQFLEALMQFHEAENPLGHVKKYELVKGDATETLPAYLEAHPETIVALAYFDFDLYAPTRKCLELILPRVVKGSVLAFDELNDPDAPGETLALMEVIGLRNVRLQRLRYASRTSYFVVE